MGGIRRKIGPAGRTGEGPSVAAAAWPLALARGAQEALALPLAVERSAAAEAGPAELAERVPERPLMTLCSGPRGALGLVALSPDLLAAVVEQQTLGRVSPRPPPPRRPTRTDAAMAAGLIDAVLAALGAAAGPDAAWAAGFHMSGTVDEVRALPLLLEEPAYRVLTAEVALAGGARQGQVLLALPAAGRGEVPAAPDPAARAGELVWQAALGEQVMAAETRVRAVLCRIALPLAEVMALAPGEVLRLGAAALDRIDLDGIDGLRMAGGRLGQNRGLRAVRLAEGGEPAARGPGTLAPGVATAEAALRRAG